jgi:hypothetical protein
MGVRVGVGVSVGRVVSVGVNVAVGERVGVFVGRSVDVAVTVGVVVAVGVLVGAASDAQAVFTLTSSTRISRRMGSLKFQRTKRLRLPRLLTRVKGCISTTYTRCTKNLTAP